jgi:NAD(P)-dependent dehydrogenase (short-subunit alcohol dehydrogenase family)
MITNYLSSSRYKGRVALITGGSRGIGLSIAERILNEGGRVCITGRKQENLNSALASLNVGDRAIAVTGHADDSDHQSETIETILKEFGQVDLLVNNAGINPAFGSLLEVKTEMAIRTFNVNVLAMLNWVRVAHNLWFDEHGGVIVNVSSVAGIRPAQGIGMYGISKAAIIQLTAQLALELSPSVRVNAVAPAVVKTKFARILYEENEGDLASTYPLKRLGWPADIASAVAYLGSDDASWVTGQTMVIDGGLTLNGGV